MKRTFLMTAMASAAALGLAACEGEEVETEPAIIEGGEGLTEVDAEIYPVGGELNEDQQANFDAMDRQAVGEEYAANVEDLRSEMEVGGSMAEGSMGRDEADEVNEMSDPANAGNMSGNMSGNGSSMPSRSNMSFAYLDRNGDGQLSVAEYAIWALPTAPIGNAPNDALPPELTQDQINQAGQTFFYFDQDGDTYLSESEFQDARNSGRTA